MKFFDYVQLLVYVGLLTALTPAIGSFMANRVSETILRTLLSVILAIVATRLVLA